MTRAQKAAKKALAEILRDWKDPHGAGSIMDERGLCGLDVNEQAMVALQIRPSRPHCPCCLVDLVDLKAKLEGHKKIVTASIESLPSIEYGRVRSAVVIGDLSRELPDVTATHSA